MRCSEPAKIPSDVEVYENPEIDTDPLEADIAKLGLFIMKLDQAITSLAPVELNHQSRIRLFDLRELMQGHKRAMLAELHQLRTPDS